MKHSIPSEEAFLRKAAAAYAQLEGEYLCQAAAREMGTMRQVPPQWDADCKRLIEEYCRSQARKSRMKKICLAAGIAAVLLFILLSVLCG